jgi:hypothetical protein
MDIVDAPGKIDKLGIKKKNLATHSTVIIIKFIMSALDRSRKIVGHKKRLILIQPVLFFSHPYGRHSQLALFDASRSAETDRDRRKVGCKKYSCKFIGPPACVSWPRIIRANVCQWSDYDPMRVDFHFSWTSFFRHEHNELVCVCIIELIKINRTSKRLRIIKWIFGS